MTDELLKAVRALGRERRRVVAGAMAEIRDRKVAEGDHEMAAIYQAIALACADATTEEEAAGRAFDDATAEIIPDDDEEDGGGEQIRLE